MSESITPHILMFPFPAQGHILPLLDLAHQFSLRRSLSITILITPKNLPLLKPLLSTHPSIKTLILPFPTHPSIPHGVENTIGLPVSGFRDMMFTLGRLYDPISQWFKNHPSPPTAVVYDLFLGWTHHLCRQIGVHGYVFSPCGGLSQAIIYSLWRDRPTRVDDGDNEEMITFSNVPKAPFYPWWQLSLVYRSFAENKEDPVSEFIEKTFIGNLSSDGLILNTFSEMEAIYLAYLKQVLGHDKVWNVGPLLPPGDDMVGSDQRGGSSSVSCDEVCNWLDRCENRSVVYVCFGSIAVLTYVQMEALVTGLEKSGVKFVLSCKCAERYGSILSRFEGRPVGRGLLINGWAPQVLILKHPAVGAFLFHCGMNSILESIVLAGVPMLAWPMTADNYTNATLIVDELKIGMKVCAGKETVPDSDELARLLAKAINEFDEEKERAMKLHKASLIAVKEGGSSFESLNTLITHLSMC